MIGVVGPGDSVAQVVAVAEEMQFDVPIASRTYRDPSSVVDQVRELDQSCSVILLTGRVPYAIASAALTPRARLEYIPHDGVDLMRVVARMLIGSRAVGEVPQVSVDSIEFGVAREIFTELGVPDAVVHAIPLVLQNRGSGFDTAAIADQHLQLFKAGAVHICLTCVDSVHRWLQQNGIPVVRVAHTQMVVRSALERCVLASQLMRASDSQVAVVLLAPTTVEVLNRRQRAVFDSLVRDAAAATQAEIVSDSKSVVRLVTTRGAVERWLTGATPGQPKILERDFAELVHVGVGLGESVALAEHHARRALPFSIREGQPFLFTAEGSSVSFGRSAKAFRARDTRAEVVDLARRLGLSPVSLQRLTFALQQLNPSAVTAAQLAVGYGVAPRSARRLLTALTNAGLAEATGTEQGPKAGRPQTVFKIHLDRLLAQTDTP